MSSTESEYIGIVEGSKVCFYAANIIQFGQNQEDDVDMLIWNDNTAAISILNGTRSGHCRTKQIKRRYHFIRHQVESGQVKVNYRSTEVLEADCLTKALTRGKFVKLRDMVMVDGSKLLQK